MRADLSKREPRFQELRKSNQARLSHQNLFLSLFLLFSVDERDLFNKFIRFHYCFLRCVD
jgi:hypothetical protein